MSGDHEQLYATPPVAISGPEDVSVVGWSHIVVEGMYA